jgi:hypothetical protein
MYELAKVSEPEGMSCYDVLEIVDNGKAYIPVASKTDSKTKESRIARLRTAVTALAVVPPTPPVAAKDIDEPEYIPYEVEDA